MKIWGKNGKNHIPMLYRNNYNILAAYLKEMLNMEVLAGIAKDAVGAVLFHRHDGFNSL